MQWAAANGDAVLSPRIARQVIDRFRGTDAASADVAARARLKIGALTGRELAFSRVLC